MVLTVKPSARISVSTAATKSRTGRGDTAMKPNTVGSARFEVDCRARRIISRASSVISSGLTAAAAKKASRGRARISESRSATTVAVWAVPAIIDISPAGSPGRITPMKCGSWPSSCLNTPRRPARTRYRVSAGSPAA